MGLGMKRYAYVRVSTDMQDYTSQRTTILRRYDRIDEWIEDTGTGRITQPNLHRLVRIAKDGDEIVVVAFDRLGREMSQVLAIVELLRRKKVGIISIREGVDLGSPAGNMVFQMLVSIAQFESTLISDRVKAGIQAVRDKGASWGRPLLTDNPKKAEALEYARQLKRQGETIRAIKSRLWKDKRVKISVGSLQTKLADI